MWEFIYVLCITIVFVSAGILLLAIWGFSGFAVVMCIKDREYSLLIPFAAIFLIANCSIFAGIAKAIVKGGLACTM